MVAQFGLAPSLGSMSTLFFALRGFRLFLLAGINRCLCSHILVLLFCPVNPNFNFFTLESAVVIAYHALRRE